MSKFFLVIGILFTSLLYTPSVLAQDNCDNRYATIVNPVRSRELWFNKSLNSIKEQYAAVKQYNFQATWLIQYDVLKDEELMGEIKKFEKQEVGIFLEVSENLAESSRVIYPHGTYWFNPKVIFLSGYSQSERKRIIDKLFFDFKKEFGFYPKSVGAWWIDSYSLDYLKEKYDVSAVMIVADQRTTDNYGVWGQWWGVPYYPSKVNILTPADNLKNKENIVIIQWAQRDPELAYGAGPMYSNYSLQANDYIRQGKNTKYFADLANIYLDCKNPLGQITVGLETGIESVGYINEYGNQLKHLSEVPELKVVTMQRFADSFFKVYPQNSQQVVVDSNWILKTDSRSNNKLKDKIEYQQNISFKDYFIPDKEDFLNRNLEDLNKVKKLYFSYFVILILGFGLISLQKKTLKLWVIGTLFILAAFGLILRSNYQLGWEVFYGPVTPYLASVQVILVATSYLFIWFLYRKFSNNLFLWFIPLSFGLDFIIQTLRFSFFDGKYYFGIALDSLRFIGLSSTKDFSLVFINQDFSSVISASLLRFDFAKIWDNLYLSLLVYPLMHIPLALLFGYLVIKFPKIKKVVIIILTVLMFLHLLNIFQADPRLVQ